MHMRWNLSRKSNKEEIGIEENEGKSFHRHRNRIYKQLVVEKQSFQWLTSKFQGGRAGETADRAEKSYFRPDPSFS
jgi:hypothetical protein